jgi:hypothetical protein
MLFSLPSPTAEGAARMPRLAAEAGPAQHLTFQATRVRRRMLAGVGAVAATGLVFVVFGLGGGEPVQIIRSAVCTANSTANAGNNAIDCNAAGLGGITSAAEALISPILVALFAVSPIACLIGVGAVMVGSRRGIVIIASALGALVLAGAIRGIVA